jgi:hypothetical protein
MGSSQWWNATIPTVGNLSSTVTLRARQVMLTPRFEVNLSQHRRTQSLAGEHFLEAQRAFSRTLIGLGYASQLTKASRTWTPLNSTEVLWLKKQRKEITKKKNTSSPRLHSSRRLSIPSGDFEPKVLRNRITFKAVTLHSWVIKCMPLWHTNFWAQLFQKWSSSIPSELSFSSKSAWTMLSESTSILVSPWLFLSTISKTHGGKILHQHG